MYIKEVTILTYVPTKTNFNNQKPDTPPTTKINKTSRNCTYVKSDFNFNKYFNIHNIPHFTTINYIGI
jgi:hypothetical protein